MISNSFINLFLPICPANEGPSSAIYTLPNKCIFFLLFKYGHLFGLELTALQLSCVLNCDEHRWHLKWMMHKIFSIPVTTMRQTRLNCCCDTDWAVSYLEELKPTPDQFGNTMTLIIVSRYPITLAHFESSRDGFWYSLVTQVIFSTSELLPDVQMTVTERFTSF